MEEMYLFERYTVFGVVRRIRLAWIVVRRVLSVGVGCIWSLRSCLWGEGGFFLECL